MRTSFIPLPPSPLDPVSDRFTLFESTGGPDEVWRIASLSDGRYTFELDAHGRILLCEQHSSLTDALARLNAWRRVPAAHSAA